MAYPTRQITKAITKLKMDYSEQLDASGPSNASERPVSWKTAPFTSVTSQSSPHLHDLEGQSTHQGLRQILTLSSNFREVRHTQYCKKDGDALLACAAASQQRDEPIIIEGLHSDPNWQGGLLNFEWLRENCAEEGISVQDGQTGTRRTVNMGSIDGISGVPGTSRAGNQSIYADGVECPEAWEKWLVSAGVLPDELLPCGPDDLFQHMPLQFRSQILSLALSVGQSSSTLHTGPCSTVTHYLTCHVQGQDPSFCFIVPRIACRKLVKYFRSKCKEIDLGTKSITIEDLIASDCTVYVAEQKLGDLLIVPPNSFHQTINSTGLRLTMSWSRMPIQSLKLALHGELDIYRSVCRAEIYRCKLLTFFAVGFLIRETLASGSQTSSHLDYETETLLDLFQEILIEEWSENRSTMAREPRPWLRTEVNSNTVLRLINSDDVLKTCYFCRSDIFVSCFRCNSSECKSCQYAQGKVYLCVGCVVEGRNCDCKKIVPVQTCEFDDVLGMYNIAASLFDRPFLTDESIRAFDHLHLFHAAYQLRCVPRKTRGSYLCRIIPSLTHSCETPIISCQGCRCGGCYAHLLHRYICSAEAILMTPGSRGDEEWHKFHGVREDRKVTSLKRFEYERRTHENRLEDYSIACRMAIVAHEYLNAVPDIMGRPLGLGWYDMPDLPEIHNPELVPGYSKKKTSISLFDVERWPKNIPNTAGTASPDSEMTLVNEDMKSDCSLSPAPDDASVKLEESPDQATGGNRYFEHLLAYNSDSD
ncbi:hypothetical protein SISSUDRAFT_1119928 [Sistotremastrum suecicum HHB10207 ss-3]|uniref:JmjC domain-containing protein n=1 Tax=Sistotremastrum suecicum HHB10207 ss-3 TaxID=1314776 RepID=A0A166CZ25_9AGAM|nr:hypothetical protein SISSUDRAFT_1119928 [Sistotremastrum suecicum HHB10207 ss-3]